jgi:hypothetical protein
LALLNVPIFTLFDTVAGHHGKEMFKLVDFAAVGLGIVDFLTNAE